MCNNFHIHNFGFKQKKNETEQLRLTMNMEEGMNMDKGHVLIAPISVRNIKSTDYVC